MTAVVLGGGIEKGLRIPDFVKKRLDKAFDLYKKREVSEILLCGRYSFLYDKSNLPKKTESQLNKKYLLDKGVKSRDIFMENKSKDTIGNVYYAKKIYFLPRKKKEIIVITSDFHIKRAKFLFKRIFGKKYIIRYVSTPSNLPKKTREDLEIRQDELIEKSKDIFYGMNDGDHNFLKGKLYKIKYYTEKRPSWVTNFVAKAKKA